MWGGGLGTGASTRPNLREPIDAGPPPEPAIDEEDGGAERSLPEARYDKLPPQAMLDDDVEDMYSAPRHANFPEPTTDDEDEDAQPDWETMSRAESISSQMRKGMLLPPSPLEVSGGYVGGTPDGASKSGNDGFYALASLLKPPKPLKPGEDRTILRAYGYRGINRGTKFSDPILSISLERHFERSGHTWYELTCSLRPDSTVSGWTNGISWTVHRRLAMLRRDLHDRVKPSIGKIAYAETFQNNRFPSRGGLPGTSAKLKSWLATLSKWVNSGKAPSLLVAHLLKFLDIPPANESQITAANFGTASQGDPRRWLKEGPEAETAEQRQSSFLFERDEDLEPSALSEKLFPDDEEDEDEDHLRL